MKILIAIIIGIVGLFLCGLMAFFFLGAILLAPLKYKYWNELRSKSKEQLEKEVFDFPEDYFNEKNKGAGIAF